MDFSFTPEQLELRAQARSFLEARFPLLGLAALIDSDPGWDPKSWTELARLGWLGVSVAGELGGAGLGFVEEAILLEEFGRCLYPGPYMTTVAMALPALDDARLAEVAAGQSRWSALLGPGSGLVPELNRVDWVVVAARDQLLAVKARGEMRPSVDPSRPMGRLERTSEEVLCEGEAVQVVAKRMRDRLLTALALEALGGGQRVLELSLEHARNREQFGKPIGAYQAVSHPLVDSYVELELARSLAYWAAWCIADDHPDASLAASAAKAAGADAGVRACERAIQTQGGLGFTWESPLHRFYKRALWIESFGGDPAAQRRWIAQQLLRPGPPPDQAEAELAAAGNGAGSEALADR